MLSARLRRRLIIVEALRQNIGVDNVDATGTYEGADRRLRPHPRIEIIGSEAGEAMAAVEMAMLGNLPIKNSTTPSSPTSRSPKGRARFSRMRRRNLQAERHREPLRERRMGE